jgi:uncharacterized membrane protein
MGKESFGQRWKRRLRWTFARHLTFGGLAGALLAFCLSLTPSLLPRAMFMQGLVSGVTGVIGYGLGSAASAITRRFLRREPAPRTKRIAWWTLLGVAAVSVPLFLWLGSRWQETVRSLMDMEPLEPASWGGILVISVATAYLLLVISRMVRGLARSLIGLIDRVAPRAISVPVGIVLTAILVAGMIQGFILDPALEALNTAFSITNDGTSEGIVPPDTPLRSGSPQSEVPWDSLGVKGRDFIGRGPTVEEISDFNGSPAREPIRIYVGLRSAPSLDDRVDLVMKELDRTDAWSRDVLVIFTTTGTGWVDPQVVDPVEYMHGGDTAIVATQYSYLPSWISFLVDQQKAADAGRAVIGAVSEKWASLPEDTRPKLLLFGESLGSFGTESAFSDLEDMRQSADGALLVGPVFANPIWGGLVDARDPGSPEWRPILDDGREVRFAVAPPDLSLPTGTWSSPRVVYLQHASDPIDWWHPDLLWKAPDWLSDRGPDVSPDMQWIPILTFWQTAADLAYSTGVPAGHGHVYGADPTDAWAAIYAPEGWTDADTQRLHELISEE